MLTEAKQKDKATHADYQALPEGAPYQLIDGELIVAPSPRAFIRSSPANSSFCCVASSRSTGAATCTMPPST